MIRDMNASSKEDQKFIGPYKVVRRMVDGCYAVEDSKGLYSSTIPLNRMKIVGYRDNESDLFRDKYEVEIIVDHRDTQDGREKEYLIKWKGYPKSEATWEPRSNIDTDECIKQYWRRLDAQEKR
jgi:hypothetical protein